MKKLAIIVFICIFSLSMSGCGNRQYFSENLISGTRWESENPAIWFEVDENGQCFGEIVLDGKVLQIEIAWRPFVFDIMSIENELTDISASCYLKKHKNDWFTVEVSTNNIPDSTAKEITFKRVATEQH